MEGNTAEFRRVRRRWFCSVCESRAHSESLLSELDPLELLLPDPEELLLLSRDGPPEGAEPAFSEGDAAGERRSPTHPTHPCTRRASFSGTATGFTPTRPEPQPTHFLTPSLHQY